ncbi:hypothetical protein NEFER03_2262 [Nematocida sp. LUAm3]|nr:hypothetical protein NEFER03_2262 [Nematocida sp. LUAm3]KAI5174802.1 hypothetical protein NEFER02_0912 [Nematocida sp. LUAm2]KAI5179342.1 hypothetical protein NEFER01_2184 [Nematocida sp. LUAm1]
MRKIRNAGVLSITLSISTLLLLFAMTYGTECTGLAQAQKQRKGRTHPSVSKNRSILYNPTEEEKQDSTVIALKQMVKEQVITEEDVLYLVVYCELSCIELSLKEDKKNYSVENAQDILKILNSEANSKKLIWFILAGSIFTNRKHILENSKLLDFFQTVCPGRNIVLEYMGKRQYTELLEKSRPKITRYTIRLRKLVVLSKYFKLYEEGRWNLVLYNALSTQSIPTNLITYITNVFISNWSKFNKAHIIIDIPNDNTIAMTENEKKIIKSIGKYAKPTYAIILNHLAGVANTPIYIYYPDSTNFITLQAAQITTSYSTPFNLPPISFIFFQPNSNSEETFPLETILSIASLQNCGMLIKTLDRNIISCDILIDYTLRQVELPFYVWQQFWNSHFNSFFKWHNYCFLIRDVDYSYFSYMMQSILLYTPFNYFAFLQTIEQSYTFTPLYNNCSIVNEKLENIFPNTNISGVVYHAEQHIVIMQNISNEKIVTEHETFELVDVVISKDEVFLKYSLVEKNASTKEKRKLDSTIQDENNSPPEKRIELNSHNNATNSTNTSIVDATSDNKEAGHLKSCLDNSCTIPPHPNPCSDPDFESNITLDPDFELDSKVNPTRYLGSYSDLDFDFDFLS